MPLVRISLRRGKPTAYLAALRNGIYLAMRESFNVPEDDRFILVHQHDAEEFDCDPHYLGIERSDDLVVVQIACNDTRDTTQKQAFYRRVAENLAADPGLRPEDIFINLLETKAETGRSATGSRSTCEHRAKHAQCGSTPIVCIHASARPVQPVIGCGVRRRPRAWPPCAYRCSSAGTRALARAV